MKKIITQGVFSIIIGWASYGLISSNWTSEPEWVNILLGFFLLLAPIGHTIILINGYRKAGLCSKLGVDYTTGIPCYALLGLYEFDNGQFKETLKNNSLNYVICLSNKYTFYFFNCNNTLMNKNEYSVDLTEDLNSLILFVNKQDILHFSYTDKKRGAADKIISWATNKVAGALQGLVTSRIQAQVAMDATVEVYFKQDGVVKALLFGIPESMVSDFSFDFVSLMPVLGEMKDYVSEGAEVMAFFETDSVAIKRAKKLILTFIDQLSKYQKN